MAKEKLDVHCQTITQRYGHYLGWSRRTGDKQSSMASTCGQVHPSGCGKVLCLVLSLHLSREDRPWND